MDSFVRCLKEESAAIESTVKRLDSKQVELALALLDRCTLNKAKLIITGVGKSGIVGRKIAATFSSIGLTAIYLNPLDAFHGDLGVVSTYDICLLLSNSGETTELVELIPHLKMRKVDCISIIGNINSTIANLSDVVIEAAIDKEVCPLNLAPTASTAVSMAIGDALAVGWMESRKISEVDFAINHPGGILGKKLTLTCFHLMTPLKQLKALYKNASLIDIIDRVSLDGIGCCWVQSSKDSSKMIGLITDGDIRRAFKSHSVFDWDKLSAESIMTKDPITIDQDQLAFTALKLMENNKKKSINVLPVLNNNGAMVGILRLHDLIKAGLS